MQLSPPKKKKKKRKQKEEKRELTGLQPYILFVAEMRPIILYQLPFSYATRIAGSE
jgi:hypothetical protein